jgi:His/Glu/Gln/Arg/opine family amino acid ABC transporter permease subunit
MGDISRLLADHGPAFGQALLLTWKLTALSFVPGFLLGVVVTVLRLLPLAPLRFVLTGYVEIFRNIPSVALLIFIVFALPDLNVVIDYEPSVVLTLALVCSAFTADYLRSGINTIAGSQVEAALSLGMRPMQIVCSVVLPQALRAVLGPLTSLLIMVFQSTSLAFAIGVGELTSKAFSIGAMTFQYFNVLVLAGVMYAVICIVSSRIVANVEHRLKVER